MIILLSAAQISEVVQTDAVYLEDIQRSSGQRDVSLSGRKFQSLLRQLVGYSLKGIKRTIVQQYFQEPVGTAILCSRYANVDEIGGSQQGDTQNNSARSNPVFSEFHDSDPREAVVIWDFSLNQDRSDYGSVRYKYSEWYGLERFTGGACHSNLGGHKVGIIPGIRPEYESKIYGHRIYKTPLMTIFCHLLSYW